MQAGTISITDGEPDTCIATSEDQGEAIILVLQLGDMIGAYEGILQ